MFNGTQQRLVALRNKLHAYKVSNPLNYGALTHPESTPSSSISGVVHDFQPIMDGMLFARFLARFTRTDGVNLTPYVDFAFDYTVTPNLRQQYEALGNSISGRDVEAWYERCFTGHIIETGSNYVVYAVDVNNYWYTMTSDYQATVTINVEAISPVEGELRLERVYG